MATAKSNAKPKAAAKKRAAVRKSPAKPSQIRIHVDVTDETPSYYVNHLEIGYSMHEFALNASRAPTVLSRDARAVAQSTGELLVSPELQLMFPPRTAKSLVAVLEKQIAAYEAQFGPIQEGKSDE